MAYRVINEKGKGAFNGEKFSSKKAGEQAIVDAIKGSSSNVDAMKYYRKYSVRKVLK
jgi:hypothetical protein